jgi:hypothetical protein
MTTVLFHVTSTANRESIAQHGLDWRRMLGVGLAGSESAEGECIFLARDRDEADWFVRLSRGNHRSVDIWDVTLEHDFEDLDEPPVGAPYSEVDGFLCTTEPIPPERLRLIETDF